jgi:uncharacterized membrane protein (UPF0127 family)
MNKATEILDPFEPVKSAPEATQQVIKKVLELEKSVLWQEKPRIGAEIMAIIKRAVP